MFDMKQVKLLKFNLKLVVYLPYAITALVLLFGMVFGIVDSFVLEEIIYLGAPFLSFIIWLLISVVVAGVIGGLTWIITKAYLLHIYYLISINNQLLANKTIENEPEEDEETDE